MVLSALSFSMEISARMRFLEAYKLGKCMGTIKHLLWSKKLYTKRQIIKKLEQLLKDLEEIK